MNTNKSDTTVVANAADDVRIPVTGKPYAAFLLEAVGKWRAAIACTDQGQSTPTQYSAAVRRVVWRRDAAT